jgi:hypothetical protein
VSELHAKVTQVFDAVEAGATYVLPAAEREFLMNLEVGSGIEQYFPGGANPVGWLQGGTAVRVVVLIAAVGLQAQDKEGAMVGRWVDGAR